MVRVYTTHPGDVVRIGNYGEASNDTPAEVPESVAAELEAGMAGDPTDVTKVGHVGRPSHDRFRIERDGAGFSWSLTAEAPSEAPDAVATASQEQDEPRNRGEKE